MEVEGDVGVGGHVLAIMLNPRARGSNSDLPPSPSNDGLNFSGRRLPHFEPNDCVLGVLANHVGRDEANLPPGQLREGVHDPYAPDRGLNQGPRVSGYPLIPH